MNTVSVVEPAASLRLVLASNNALKLKELSALLSPLSVELVVQGGLGVAEAEEPHLTFIENGCAEGTRMRRGPAGLPAIADDSGPCVDALSDEACTACSRRCSQP